LEIAPLEGHLITIETTKRKIANLPDKLAHDIDAPHKNVASKDFYSNSQ